MNESIETTADKYPYSFYISLYSQLERDRTIHSMSLAEEKGILKDIHKAEKAKRAVEEFQLHAERIKAKKARVAEMRSSLQTMRFDIDLLRAEISVTKTARQVGCSKETLLGMKLDCPLDKLGNIIGKKGVHVRQLMEKASVQVDIVQSKIRLLGAIENLNSAACDLSKVISAKEEECGLLPAQATFLSGRKIQYLRILQNKHPDVHIALPRNQAKLVMRGAPEEIVRVTDDIEKIDVVEKTFVVSSQEAAYIIGRKGETIERLTEQYQIVIQVGKPSGEESSITVFGLSSNLQIGLAAILELTADAREGAEIIPIDPVVRNLLLKDQGAVMKEIHQKASEKAREAGGLVKLRVDANSVIIRGKSMVVQATKDTVETEIGRIEGLLVKMSIDKSVVPEIIGKGGENLKALTQGTSVNIEFDKVVGTLTIVGSKEEEIRNVKAAIDQVIGVNQVARIALAQSLFKRQVGGLLRQIGAQIRAIPCQIQCDDDDFAIILRGEQEKINEATKVVNEFLRENHEEDLTVSLEDLRLLARGGKESKLMALQKDYDVKIISNWRDHALYIRGESRRVQNAVSAINTFLLGGDDWSIIKVKLDDRSLALIIGKGGKNLKDLQAKFDKVLLITSRRDTSIVLRGPTDDTEECRVEIVKRVRSAQISKEVDLTEANVKKLQKGRFTRDMMRDIPVAIRLEKGLVSIRGATSDVDFVIAMLNEYLYGFYESQVTLETAHYAKVKEACKKPSILDGIKNASGAFVAVSDTDEALILRGKREQVKTAKLEILRLFEFLLKPGFAFLTLPGPIASSIGKGSSIAEISASSGASVLVDRDIACALVFSTDANKLTKAVGMIQTKIDEARSSFFEIQLDESDSWLTPLIIGAKGAKITALRKDTQCQITIDSTENRITVQTADGPGALNAARTKIAAALAEERKKCIKIEIPRDDVSSFIGKKGAAINEFRAKYLVDLEIIGGNTVVIKGEPDAIEAAHTAVQSFIRMRIEASEQAKSVELEVVTLHLRKEQVPAIIGSKGAVINSLVKEFGVKIDVDRKMSIVSIRRGDRTKREACVSRIREMLDREAREQSEDEVAIETRAPGDESKPKKASKEILSPQSVSPDTALAVAVDKQLNINGEFFPPLVSTPGRSVGTLSTLASTSTPGRSWASLASENPELEHPPRESITPPPEMIRMH